MIKEIRFEDLPQKMQDEWTEYYQKYINDNIKILKICLNSSEYNDYVTYKIFYEFANILGLAEAMVLGSGYINTNFNILTIYDVKEMCRLSSMIKEFNL